MKVFRIFIVTLCFIGALLPFKYQLISVPAIFLVLLLFDKTILKQFMKKGFLIISFLLLVLQPLIAGTKESKFLYFEYSSDVLMVSLQMIFRAFMIITAFSLIMKKMDRENIFRFVSKIKLRNFEPSLKEAHRLFPEIKTALLQSIWSHKNIGKRRILNPINLIALLFANIIKNAAAAHETQINKG